MIAIFTQAINESKKDKWTKEEMLVIFKKLGELEKELASKAWKESELQYKRASNDFEYTKLRKDFEQWYNEFTSPKKK